jgi:hypothetical protein
MLLSYSKYPILKAIKENSLEIPIYAQDIKSFWYSGHKKIFNEAFKICNQFFISNIKYISRPFGDAFGSARTAIAGIIEDAVFKMESDAGVFIYPDDGVVLYKLEVYDNRVVFYVSIFYQKVIVFSGIAEFRNDGEQEKLSYWVSEAYSDGVDKFSILSTPLAYLVFMRFAKTETKDIYPGKKVDTGKEKHKNETELKIRVVGCEWITTIVRSQGFDVRGHFRLQPCGIGREDRKLIWVNPFQKNGYTRRAQVIINEENRVNA